MTPFRGALLSLVLACSALLAQQQPLHSLSESSGMPSSGGYKPPDLSLSQLIETDHVLQQALMSFMQTADRKSYGETILAAAQAGDIGAELFLAEQYIPEQCPSEPNHDVPHCGKNGNEPTHVVFRQNPLGLDASYEDAAHWLEKASAQGSGEASEVLAQLITRMQANGHGTTYTAADSARLHALARSQGFDVEPISAVCYKLTPGNSGLSVRPPPEFPPGVPEVKQFTAAEVATLEKAGISGSLQYQGGSGNGDSVLLMRPEGPIAHIRIVLYKDPGHEVLLPIPARRDVMYVQRGDTFVAFPSDGPNLPRFISLHPEGLSPLQVLLMIQTMDGGYTSGFCTSFP